MRIYETKSKRHREVALNSEQYKNLLKLTWNKSDDVLVFDSHHKTGVSVHRSTIHRHIKKSLQWLDFDASVHSARKLYAQNIYADTKSIEAVQKSLNHHKITTTMTYLTDIKLSAPAKLFYKIRKFFSNLTLRIRRKK